MLAVDRAKLAVVVGPRVPDADPAFLQPAHVGVAAQEPQQFQDDGFAVQLLGGQEREALGQVKAHLAAEDTQRAGARAVAALHTVGQDVFQ